MKIVSLMAENYKRLKAVEITPDGNLVVVGGRNAQGKSSVLDAIWAALGGREGNKAAKPIRDGESKATVRLDLGDLVVTRTWTHSGSTVKVESAEGATFKSPQSMLDDLIGRLSFDPLAFTRLSSKDQREALLGLVEIPLDLDALAAEREGLFSKRTEVGREVKTIPEVTYDSSLPVEEVSATELIGKIRESQKAVQVYESYEEDVISVNARIKEAEAELERLKEVAWGLKVNEVDQPKPGEVEELEAQLSSVETTNATIRSNNQAREQATRRAELQKQQETLTEGITALDKKKADALSKVEFPVPGLGFDESGVTFNEVPFSQASSAEQIRVSTAMGISGNPKLRVMRIMDGSLLDTENLQMISDMADNNDMQIWVERVGNQDQMGVVIEDGEVQEIFESDLF